MAQPDPIVSSLFYLEKKNMSTYEDAATPENPEADLIRASERERLRALVDANIEVATRLHADDFQLINPLGISISKEEYLSDIASGAVNYLVWEPGAIEVRLHGHMAVIRYQSRLEIIVRGDHAPLRRMWHTDLYEKRTDSWQVVWSQATVIL